MRLINANKLNLNLCNTVGDAKKEIEDAETIDAIPIERLEQEIRRYLDLGLTSVAIELRIFVDKWRKENT